MTWFILELSNGTGPDAMPLCRFLFPLDDSAKLDAAMKALVLTEPKTDARFTEIESPSIAPGKVIVRLKAASLNRRDYWITQGLYPGIKTPCTLGSDGAGIIETLGEGVEKRSVGDEVVLYPGRDWGTNEAAQADDFAVLGMPDNGTFAQCVMVSQDQLFAKPQDLDWSETAALPVAGLTAFRSTMVQGRIQPGQRILITGIGGGVAVFALQIAVAQRAQVIVTSSREEKIQAAKTLGAEAGYLYTDPTWNRTALKEHGPFDLIIDGAGGPGYGDLIALLKPGGRLVNYGSTAGRPESLDLFKVFWRQLSLIGSTLGSPRDFQAFLLFVEQHGIRPVVDQCIPLSEGGQAIAAMQQASQFGKITLHMEESILAPPQT